MKKFKKFLSETHVNLDEGFKSRIDESYVNDILNGKATDWSGPAATSLGKHIKKTGTHIGSIPRTNYKAYKLGNEYFLVAPGLVHRNGSDEPKNLVKESKEVKTPGTKVTWKWASSNKTASGVVDFDDGKTTLDVKYMSGEPRGLKKGEVVSISRKDIVKESKDTGIGSGSDEEAKLMRLTRLAMTTGLPGSASRNKVKKELSAQRVKMGLKPIKEEVAANAAGGALGTNATDGTSVAGYDPFLKTGNKNTSLKRSKFAGAECFEVDSDTFNKCRMGHQKNERWNKYLKDDCEQCQAIHAYSKRHPQKDIVIQNKSVAQEMTYLKKKNIHY